MDAVALKTIAGKELRDSLRTRWFWMYTAAFAMLASGLSYLANSFAGWSGVAGFGRTAAGLVNLILLVVPLMGLTAGALAISGEGERGTLGYLLAQPVTRAEVFFGKFLGLAAALAVAVLFSFGLTGLIVSLDGAPFEAGAFGAFTLLTVALALVALSLGCLISALSARVAGALGAAVFLWLALVFLGDLGLMATALAARLGIRAIFALSLLNPLQLFKVAVITKLQPSLEVLGPVGLFAADTLGAGVLPLFSALLAVWIVAPLGIAYLAFERREFA